MVCGIIRYTWKVGKHYTATYQFGNLALLGPDMLLTGTPPCKGFMDSRCDCPAVYKSEAKRFGHCGYCGGLYIIEPMEDSSK
jgi:hypothetical protein